MKNTTFKLILGFLILATLGGIMTVSGNTLGDYLLLTSVFIGIFIQIRDSREHDCSDHEKTVSRSLSQDGDTGTIVFTGKEVKCAKCGKTRTV